MQNVILVIHILACLAMIGLVLLQKSEGGGLGIGGGGSNSLMSGRGAAGALVRATMLFGAIFFATSLALTSIANRSADSRSGIERVLEQSDPLAPLETLDLLDPTISPFSESLASPPVDSIESASPDEAQPDTEPTTDPENQENPQ